MTAAALPGTRPGRGDPAHLEPIPLDFGVELDPDTKELEPGILFGGSPARVLRLTPAGQQALAELRGGIVRTPRAATLARRLIDAGAAHPRPPRAATADVTVIIPVRDRPELLDRCLTALGGGYPVIVVDDGSVDSVAVAEVAGRHSARLLVHRVNAGPAAARNAGIAASTSEFIALIDSDCVPTEPWIEPLADHFADPLVAAVAPRILPLVTPRDGLGAADRWAARFAQAAGGLDLGDRESRVAPGSRVSYVPTAALLVRRSALPSAGPGPFDRSMRVGEDVDLIWRLHETGWHTRYVPAVQVWHQDPQGWAALLRRRFGYGTSAGPLARRHPDAMAPLALHPWPALTVGALLARRPLLAAAAFAGSVLTMRSTLVRHDIPTTGVLPAMARATQQTFLGIGRYGTQFAAPALVAALLLPGGSPLRRWGRRAAAGSLLLGPAIDGYVRRRPRLDPARFVLGQLADDVSYGAGVWTGAVRARTAVPVLPRIVRRPLRISGPPRNS